MEENNIFTRHNTDKGFNIAGAFLELEARLKTAYTIIDELKEVIQGQAKWSETIEIRIKKLEPTIQVFQENELNKIIKK